MKIKSRITVRSEEEAINNAIKQGLMKDSNNHKYLYSKLYKLDNEWHDIFLNLSTNHNESVRVEKWIDDSEK
jgi:hypothetical protein